MTGILNAMVGLNGVATLPAFHVFSTPGATTDTVPVGATTAVIEVWGAAGGGGLQQTAPNNGGGGGGSGGYARTSLSVAGHSGQTLNITIGNPGSATTVASGTLTVASMSAPSGVVGADGSAGSAGGAAGATGTGGTVTNSVGIAGGPGDRGDFSGGTGALAVTGVNGTGPPGGHGGITQTSGVPGKVVIKYT